MAGGVPLSRVRARVGRRHPHLVRGNGPGPSLVLVHPAMFDHRAWDHVAQRFAAYFAVYAMDRRGRGGSGPFTEDHFGGTRLRSRSRLPPAARSRSISSIRTELALLGQLSTPLTSEDAVESHAEDEPMPEG